ncbi:MAG TPA: PDZ domain-containing protein, partial [Candidatus Polarisedimenticolaceae bacterium]|nr:PDZ domain-containing protein [Candidatus Polarisedimenticolaceae bacterium]
MLDVLRRSLPAGLAAGWVLVAVAPAAAQEVVIAGSESESPSVFFVDSRGSSPYLGVQLEEETDWHEGGARVTAVVGDSPAERAGLREGDIIVEFGGKTIRGPVALTNAIHEKEAGDTVELKIVRDGKKQSLDAELGERGAAVGYSYAPGALEWVAPEIDEELREKLDRSLEHVYGLGSCQSEECTSFGFSFNWAGRPRLGVQLVDATPELRQ